MTRWIVVVEDQQALGEMICDNLRSEGYGAELICNGTVARARIARGGIDLVVLDIMLPGEDGFSVLQAMRDGGDDTPVLILSARSRDDDKIRGLELRADDYLTKPFNLKELLLRVRALLRRRGANGNGNDSLEFGDNEIDFRSHKARNWDNAEIQLTPGEVKLLRLLASRQGEVVTRQELVDLIFGPQTPPTHRSLDNMVLNLRRYFERDSKTPAHLHTIRGVGLRLTTERELR